MYVFHIVHNMASEDDILHIIPLGSYGDIVCEIFFVKCEGLMFIPLKFQHINEFSVHY